MKLLRLMTFTIVFILLNLYGTCSLAIHVFQKRLLIKFRVLWSTETREGSIIDAFNYFRIQRASPLTAL